MRKNKNTGFTILELLVVIAVAAMISSFVMVSLRDTRRKSRDTMREQHIKQIQNALALYASNAGGYYPQCASEVIIGATSGAYIDNCIRQKLIDSGAIVDTPIDPILGTSGTCGTVGSYAYCYKTSAAGDNIYELRYALEGDSILGKSADVWYTITP